MKTIRFSNFSSFDPEASLEVFSSNKNTEVNIRETAYRCIFYVSPLTLENRPNQILDWDHFDENVDWKLIEKLISEAQ